MSTAADIVLRVKNICVCAQLSSSAVGESLALWGGFPRTLGRMALVGSRGLVHAIYWRLSGWLLWWYGETISSGKQDTTTESHSCIDRGFVATRFGACSSLLGYAFSSEIETMIGYPVIDIVTLRT